MREVVWVFRTGNRDSVVFKYMMVKQKVALAMTAEYKSNTPLPKAKGHNSKRIIFLDYLRIFAFSSVLIGHKFYNDLNVIVDSKTIHTVPKFFIKLLLPFFNGGGAGVVVFFLVSGYIITQVLRSEKPLEFAIKRIFRIYPIYFVAVFFQIVVSGNFPAPGVLVAQLLLVGDFFDAPNTLGGVEWTLRVEIMFYVFMGVLKSLGLLDKYKYALPWTLAAATIVLGLVGPFPNFWKWTEGFFTLFGPFLFVGLFFNLRENKEISLVTLLLFVGLVFGQYYYLLTEYQPKLLNEAFTIIGFLIFVSAWNLRSRLKVNSLILFFSNLTYTVYLFHNWLWETIHKTLAKLSITILHPEIQVFVVLLLVCFIMHKSVEKGGIRLGRVLLKYLESVPKSHFLRRLQRQFNIGR